MSTTIRPAVSEKNKYFIEKHRYYELKHFCLQYPTWKKARDALDGLSQRPNDLAWFAKMGKVGDPTARRAEMRLFYSDRMEMVGRAAEKTHSELALYIFKAVTEGLSYERLKTAMGIPCGKDTYYEAYRRFFWLLNKERQ